MANTGSNPFDSAGQARKRLTAAAAAAAVAVLFVWLFEFGATLDLRVMDQWFSIRGPRDPSPQVVVVGIDSKSLAAIGRWPWSRDTYAPLVTKLNQLGARVIGFDFVFGPDPQENKPGPPVPAPAAPDGTVQDGATVPGPSHNEIFAQAMREAGNVVFGIEFNHLGDTSAPGGPPPPEILRNAVPAFDVGALNALQSPEVGAAETTLAEAAAALGFVNALPEADGAIRRYPMLIKHGERYFPSLSLQMARVYMRKPIEEVKASDGLVTIDFADIPIGNDGRMMLDWTSTEPTFPTVSVNEVLRGEVAPSFFQDKAVIIAGTAAGMDDRDLPFVKTAPGVLLHATVLDNIFKIKFFRWPPWSWLLTRALIPILLLLGVLIYPRLKTMYLLLLGPGIAVALLGVSLVLFLAPDNSIWFAPFLPALAAFLPVLPVVALKLRETEAVSRDIGAEKLETEMQLGLSFQEKGMLDMALAQFTKLPVNDRMKGVLLNLGLDFENRGQREKAFLAYKRVFDQDAGYEDVAPRMEAMRQQGVGTRVFATGTMDMAGSAPTRVDQADSTRALGTRGAAPTMAGATIGSRPGEMRTSTPTSGPGATVAPDGRTSAGVSVEDGTLALGASSPRGSLVAGARFGRYEIVQKLGRGAMGDVFQVRDPKIGRIAAMKTIRVDMDLAPQQLIELRQRFYREAQTAGKLTHPNIVTIYDVGEEDGISYIVMEFVEGDTLTNLVKKLKALNTAQIKHVICLAASGLDYAHQNGVIHRDIKPDNIMLSSKGSIVKVMDFGIARIVESDMTRTGSVLGTPAYMSPEQFSGKKVDGRADIFSLGVVLYELIAKKRPFRGDTPTAVMFEILQKEAEPPSVTLPGASPLWDPIVLKALSKNPDGRYATAAEFANAVRAVAVK